MRVLPLPWPASIKWKLGLAFPLWLGWQLVLAQSIAMAKPDRLFYLRVVLWMVLPLTSSVVLGQTAAAPVPASSTPAIVAKPAPVSDAQPMRLMLKLAKNGDSDLIDSHPYKLTVDPIKLTSTVTISAFTMQVDSTQTPEEVATVLLDTLRATAKKAPYTAAIRQSTDWKSLLLPGAKWPGRDDNEKELNIEKRFFDYVENRLKQQAAKDKLKLSAATSDGSTNAALKQSDFQLGVGLGWSIETSRSYSYSLLAPDYRIKAEKENRAWPVISAVLCYNPKLYYIKRGDERKPAAQQRTELKASRLAILAAFNYNDVFSAAPNFNQRLGLGLGIGYAWRLFGDSRNIFTSIFVDGRLVRFLRDGYSENEPLKAFPATTGSTSTPQVVTSLNINDETYFVTHPVVGISLKAVFLFTGGAPKYSISKTVQ